MHVVLEEVNNDNVDPEKKCRLDGDVCHRYMLQTQTCHSMEMKNLDLTNKKSGFGGKNRDHGQIGYKKK